MHDGPLDMRFNQMSDAPTAADVLNTHSEVQLAKVLRFIFLVPRLAKGGGKSWEGAETAKDDNPAGHEVLPGGVHLRERRAAARRGRDPRTGRPFGSWGDL
ncbi:S-adenosyl-methyltransferase mraw [Globisporangium polare]